MEADDGQYRLIDGYHRHAASVKANKRKIDILVAK